MYRLLDSAGNVRATFKDRPTPETLLRSAWSLGPDDRLTVLGHGESDWSLSVYRPGAAVKAQFIGPTGTRDRSTLIDLAWLALIDDGWSVAELTQPE